MERAKAFECYWGKSVFVSSFSRGFCPFVSVSNFLIRVCGHSANRQLLGEGQRWGMFPYHPRELPERNTGQKKPRKNAPRKIKYGEEEKSLQSFAFLIEKVPLG